LASGGTDKIIRLWETNQFAPKGTLQGAIQSLTAIDFSSDDSMVLGASNDNAIRVWHQGTQRLRVRRGDKKKKTKCLTKRLANQIAAYSQRPYKQSLRSCI